MPARLFLGGTEAMAHANWAGNLTYGTTDIAEPATVAEVQEVVKGAAKLRALGSRHCFNDIADTTGTHVSLAKLRGVVGLDTEKRQVRVEGGARYGDIGGWLHERGFALANLASLPHISVPGAIATATHGSGVKLGNLATAVSGVQFVDGNGDLQKLSREKNPDVFPGAVVSLGALGVVTAVTLDVVPAFDVRQDVYLDMPLEEAKANFEAIMAAGYSVSYFTGWQSDVIEQVWVKSRTDGDEAFALGDTLFGAKLATRKVHPLIDFSAEPCTDQMGMIGPWHDRLPHFRMAFVPASGEEIQVEYFIPRRHAAAGMQALRDIGDAFADILLVSEVRTVAADNLWLSMAYKQDVVAFHFSFRRDPAGVLKILGPVEAALAPFNPRAHWGKVFSLPPETVRAAYEKLPDFRKLAAQFDPAGKFRNAFVDKYVFGG